MQRLQSSGKTAERACFDDGIAEELYVWGFAGPSGVQIYGKQIKNSLQTAGIRESSAAKQIREIREQ